MILSNDAVQGVAVSIVNDITRSRADFDYLELIWRTKTKQDIKIRSMSRSHVRNTLQWCIRKNAGPDDEKDGILYKDWIAYFTIRLLDPDLGE
ncbi:MAG TPA: hypothetical protein VFM18_17665 [Methanosarcina sp.]|nr:hypothetical protein [Methanosarcina sp.]